MATTIALVTLTCVGDWHGSSNKVSIMTQAKIQQALNDWCAARGLTRLPDSAYGEHVNYLLARIPGRKTPIRVLVLR